MVTVDRSRDDCAQARLAAAEWDAQVAQIFPQSVEKLPLFHWHHGQRMLCIGSRDGAAYDQNIAQAEANTFHRPLSVELIQASQKQLATDGICITMSASLWFPRIVEMCREAADKSQCPLLMVTPGFGDEEILDRYLTSVDAWILMIDDHPGPLSSRIMQEGRHVELMWGLSESFCHHDLPWSSLSAVHLRPRTALQSLDNLRTSYDNARSALPQSVCVYDDMQQHSVCTCGETLVWRQGGRSRIDGLDIQSQVCTACGAPVPWATQ